MSIDFKEIGQQFAKSAQNVLDNEQVQHVRNFFKDNSFARGVAASLVAGSVILAGSAVYSAFDGMHEIDLRVAENADGCPVTAAVHQQLNSHMLRNEGVESAQGYMVFQMDDGETVICSTSYGPEAGAHEVNVIPPEFAAGPTQ